MPPFLHPLYTASSESHLLILKLFNSCKKKVVLRPEFFHFLAICRKDQLLRVQIMKLKVKQTGLVEKELDVTIKNPAATIANVRAAIAIHFKLDPHSFTMIHQTASLEDATKLLTQSGVAEGDCITLVTKRPREESDAAVAAADRPTVASAPVPVTSSAPASTTASARSTGGQRRRRVTVPHVLAEEPDEFLEQHQNADDSDDEPEFDEEDEEEEGEEVDSDLADMVSEILSIPDILSLREQFLHNPQQVLQGIQNTNPRLFQLITRYHQQFLDLVQNQELLETLQMEQDEEDATYIGEEMEEMDEEEEAMLHDAIIQALEQERNSVESSATLGRNATQILSNRSTAVSSRANTGGEGGAATATTGRRIPEVISDEDNAKIEELMSFGFTKEQCTAAFFQCNRSMDRAANLLFENPPTI